MLNFRLARAKALAVTLPLAACAAVGPDYQRPKAMVPAKYKEFKGWKQSTPCDDFDKGEWWKAFGDRELDRLEAQVKVSNQTLKADEANYREALALIAQARAGLFPALNFDPLLVRSSPGINSLNAEVSGSWTLDIWGKVRRTIEEQGAAAEASAAVLANATLSAQSALALAYVQLRAADSAHDLFANTVKQYQRSLEITKNQYDAGTAAKTDVITAQAQLLAAEAQEISTGVARAQNEHAIAVLMGRPPSELSVPHGKLAEDLPSIPVSVPSSLLERRPDIAAAERTMAEQNAAIGVAISGYYPSVTLSGAVGYLGDPFRHLAGANPVWSYGLSLAQILFNGGLTSAQVEAARATYESGVATYRQTVLTAFQQVEDALVAIRIYGEEAKVQSKAVNAAQQAVQIALNEYRVGTQNFTTVVTAEATLLNDEESLLITRTARMTAAVNLIVALGGGWSEGKLPRPTVDANTDP
jgi:NodT family efflux transporter outer membrane factor (OMF) lipoprotein